MQTKLFIILIFLLLPFSTHAVVLENFDALNTGQLNGQGGWSGGTDTQVTSAVNQSGTRAVGKSGGGGISDTKKSITPINTDTSTASCYVRSTTVNNGAGGSFGCAFFDDASEIVSLKFDDEGNRLIMVGASTVSLLSSPSANTWYQLEVEFNFTANTVRARYNGGSWSSSINALASLNFAEVTHISTRFGGLAGDAYLDTIEATYVEEEGEPDPEIGGVITPDNTKDVLVDMAVDFGLAMLGIFSIVISIGLGVLVYKVGWKKLKGSYR